MSNPWLSLEVLPSLTAILPVWRFRTGDDFPALRALCLDPSDRVAAIYPCRKYGVCGFRIVHQPDGSITGYCESRPPKCPDAQFSKNDVAVLELNWQKLGRAICKAFGLDYKFADLGLWKTYQIGTWSADAVPAILSIKHEIKYQHSAVAHLVSTLNQKFILFAPTNRTMDVPCLQILNRVHAEFFPLDKTTTLTQNGTLHSVKTPGELFANFTPQPKETDKSVAERAFALVQQLDTNGPKKPPSVLTVFRLYCIEELSAEQIARKTHSSKATIVRRLVRIRQKTGIEPKDLRRISGHLEDGTK